MAKKKASAKANENTEAVEVVAEATTETVTAQETPPAPVADEHEAESLTIVIPYKSAPAKGDELRYALRAWEKHLPHVKILIVGDLPDFVSPKVLHIPHTPTSDNPQVDVAQKLLAAIESDLVPEYFVISNDDIYPVADLTISQIDIHTANGPLGTKGAPGGVYNKNAARTLAALKQAGVTKPMDYATHTPMGVHKDGLKEIIESFKCDKEGHLVTTLYFNLAFPGIRPIIVDNGMSPDHAGTRCYVASAFRQINPKIIEKAFAERIFINNNDRGWSSVEPFLQKLFPQKCKFEK